MSNVESPIIYQKKIPQIAVSTFYVFELVFLLLYNALSLVPDRSS